MTDIPTLRRILQETRVVASVGLSRHWYRPSFFAAKYLQEHGYRVIPVNPRYQEILGEKCYPSLREIPEKVDVVQLFQRADRVMPFVEDAIEIGAKVLWMQLGIANEEAAARARGRTRSGDESVHEDRARAAVRGAQLRRRQHEGDLLEARQGDRQLRR